MKLTNLTPEVLEILNRQCDPDELECRIRLMEDTEEQLEDLAYQHSMENRPKEALKLYNISHSLKDFKKDLTKLRNMITDGTED